jgi:hypothetical protein
MSLRAQAITKGLATTKPPKIEVMFEIVDILPPTVVVHSYTTVGVAPL